MHVARGGTVHSGHVRMRGFTEYVCLQGQIGFHHAWADSPVKVLSEVGFNGGVDSAWLVGGGGVVPALTRV